MLPVQIRVDFAVDDVELSHLHARAFAFSSIPSRVDVQPWRARLERHSLTWVGGFSGHTLVGFVHACWDGGRHAFLLDTVVDPDFRRQRLGSSLVARLITEVRRAECDWLHVDYEPHLHKFYAAAGFQPTMAGLIQLH